MLGNPVILPFGFGRGQAVGKDVVDRLGISGTSHSHEMVTTTAAIIDRCQPSLLEKEMQYLAKSGCVPVMVRWYDPTPRTVRFGRLQQLVMPHARYPILEDNKWRTVSYEDLHHPSPYHHHHHHHHRTIIIVPSSSSSSTIIIVVVIIFIVIATHRNAHHHSLSRMRIMCASKAAAGRRVLAWWT